MEKVAWCVLSRELTVVRGAQTLTLTVTPTARPKNAREREKAGPAAINTI